MSAAAMAAIWEQHLPTMLARVDVLERAVAGDVDAEQARTAAHQLAGSVGTFGFTRASELARECETLLRSGAGLAEAGSLVTSLRAELETPAFVADVRPAAPPAAPPAVQTALTDVLFVTADAETARRLLDESARRGLRATAVANASVADSAIRREPPSVLVVDDAALELLDRATVPVIVTAAQDSLVARLETLRGGAAAFVGPEATAADVVETVAMTLETFAPRSQRVLAIGAVPALDGLEIVRTDANRLIADLSETDPALVLLGDDAGELCSVLRADRRWASLPVIALGTEPVAGADDTVSDTSELVAHIRLRLERALVHRVHFEADPLTGAGNRRASSAAMACLVRLADRLEQPLCLVAIEPDEPATVPLLAQVLRRSLRGEDVIGLWEPDRILVGMLGLGRDTAVDRINGVRSRSGLGFSAGISQFPRDGTDLAALVEAANGALKAALGPGGEQVLGAGRGAAVTKQVDVAIIEDEEAAAQLIFHTLSERGHSCWRFSNGAGAVAMLAGEHPQLRASVILLDLNLPAVDGVELLTLLARDGVLRASRLFVVSANEDPGVMARTRELGAEDYLVKPVDLAALAARVDAALGRQR